MPRSRPISGGFFLVVGGHHIRLIIRRLQVQILPGPQETYQGETFKKAPRIGGKHLARLISRNFSTARPVFLRFAWLARHKGPDGRLHSRSFRRKIDAEEWLALEESKSIKGEWVDPAAGKATYWQWSETWLAGLHSVKPKTLAGYESLLRSRVLPDFGDMELPRISTASVRSWVASMVEEGLSSARIRQVLHASLDVAVDDGLIARNPTDRVKAPRVEKRRQLFLTAFELGRLADEATPYDTLVWFLGWSGLRWGEAVALRAGRVDGRRIRVEESATEVGGKLEWGRPKTNEAPDRHRPQSRRQPTGSADRGEAS